MLCWDWLYLLTSNLRALRTTLLMSRRILSTGCRTTNVDYPCPYLFPKRENTSILIVLILPPPPPPKAFNRPKCQELFLLARF
jgi:hypothetical protein